MADRNPPQNLVRRLVAEAVGTGFLLAAVVGSGIMGERLAGGNVAIPLCQAQLRQLPMQRIEHRGGLGQVAEIVARQDDE